MRALAKFGLLVLGALLLYNLCLAYTYGTGKATSVDHSTIIRIADELNAKQRAEVDRILEEVRSGRELDVARLRTILRASAVRAGQLRELEAERKALAIG